MFVLVAYDLIAERSDSDRENLRDSLKGYCLGCDKPCKLSESCYSFYTNKTILNIYDELKKFTDNDDTLSVVEISDIRSDSICVANHRVKG